MIKKNTLPIYATSGCQEIIERKKKEVLFLSNRKTPSSLIERKKYKMQLFNMKMHIHYDHGVSDAEVALL
jgi:hypothetical protein